MKPLYIGATLQDCGKTSFCVGLLKLLKEKNLDPGYFKPVGQHYLRYKNKNIDEDAVLVHKVFGIKDLPYYLSPIAIERNFTRKFIFDPKVEPLEKEILQCSQQLYQKHYFVIVEGTGHAGVGSCFGLSNARVAELLDAKVVIVTSGGIGKPLDEIALSLALYRHHNVEVIGVILNKVLQEKYAKVTKTVRQGLKNMGTRLVGSIPYEPDLTFFKMEQLADEMKFDVYSGKDHLGNIIENKVVSAMEPQHALKYITKNSLVIIPADRTENIRSAVNKLTEFNSESGGLILTGGLSLNSEIKKLLKKSHIPVLTSKLDTFKVSSKIADLEFKLQSSDTNKIEKLHYLVKEYVDVDYLLNKLKED